MAKMTARTGTAPFAHLLALVTGGRTNAARAEEDEKPDEGAEDEKPEEDASEEKPEEGADDKKPEDGKPESKGRRARSGKAEKEEDEDAEEKAESDDDDEEMAQARREGFAAAQARGRRIFNAASAGKRPDMAAHLAFNDHRSSADAVAMLDMAASGILPNAQPGTRIGRRMARVVLPNPGASSGGKKPEELSFGELAKAAAEKAGIL